jgi:hypothetical protein
MDDEDDSSEGGLLDQVETNLEQIGENLLFVVSLGTLGGEMVPGMSGVTASADQGLSSIASGVENAIIPSTLSGWSYLIIVVVILVLLAYIAREVIG